MLEPGETCTLRVDLDKAVGSRSESGGTTPRWTLAWPSVVSHQSPVESVGKDLRLLVTDG